MSLIDSDGNISTDESAEGDAEEREKASQPVGRFSGGEEVVEEEKEEETEDAGDDTADQDSS